MCPDGPTARGIANEATSQTADPASSFFIGASLGDGVWISDLT